MWPPSPPALIAMILMLIGVVMLMSGRGALQTGRQIGLVILGFLVLMGVFALVVNRAL